MQLCYVGPLSEGVHLVHDEASFVFAPGIPVDVPDDLAGRAPALDHDGQFVLDDNGDVLDAGTGLLSQTETTEAGNRVLIFQPAPAAPQPEPSPKARPVKVKE